MLVFCMGINPLKNSGKSSIHPTTVKSHISPNYDLGLIAGRGSPTSGGATGRGGAAAGPRWGRTWTRVKKKGKNPLCEAL